MIPCDKELRAEPMVNCFSPIFTASIAVRLDRPFQLVDPTSPFFVCNVNPPEMRNALGFGP